MYMIYVESGSRSRRAAAERQALLLYDDRSKIHGKYKGALDRATIEHIFLISSVCRIRYTSETITYWFWNSITAGRLLLVRNPWYLTALIINPYLVAGRNSPRRLLLGWRWTSWQLTAISVRDYRNNLLILAPWSGIR